MFNVWQELLLHGNRIAHLRQCDKYLPTSLTTLTLASNNIGDLNEMSQLVHLINLVNFSISNNPCVNMTNGNVYPFLTGFALVIFHFHCENAIIKTLKCASIYSKRKLISYV